MFPVRPPQTPRLLLPPNHAKPNEQAAAGARSAGSTNTPVGPFGHLKSAPPRSRLLMAQPKAPSGAPTPRFDRNDPAAWRLRSTDDISGLPPTVNTLGLRELRLSGSASISSEAQVQELSRLWRGSLHVIDLRQEPHAVVEGVPVTWIAGRNWAGIGKSREEALGHEQALIEKFRHEKEAHTLQSYEDLAKGRPPKTVTLSGASAKDVASLVTAAGVAYTRLMVSDHLRPSDEDVDLFIATVRQLAPGTGLHIHCKGGMGRTMTHMAMYDMLHNAGTVSAADILARQAALGGGYDLAASRGNPATQAFHDDRLTFLKEFHAFAMANPKGQPQTWSEWLDLQPVQAGRAEGPRRNSVA